MKVFSVSELNRQIKNRLEEDFSDVWLEGEISNLKPASSGHIYLSLKDSQSQIGAVVFRGVAAKLRFQPENGLAVLAYGRVTVYEPRGNYQVIVEHLEPKGVGALQLAFEQLKRKLSEEGLFDAERKKPIPFLPRKIGIVTSPTGAVIRDMIHVLTRRFPSIHIILRPVLVQGAMAASEIAEAIRDFNERDDVDVLIVGRGGGSIEDLWAFNEEVVARAIATSGIPVISAVGHETDFTIADFVADVRAPTPSAAAEIAVPMLGDLEHALDQHRYRLTQSLQQKLENAWLRLRHCESYFLHPERRFASHLMKLDHFRESMAFQMRHRLELCSQALQGYGEKLKILDPESVLERGYAIVTREDTGRAIKDGKSVAAGDDLRVRVHGGRFKVKVVSGSY